MKKFVKVSLIISVIVMFLGIIIYVIGYAGGGQKDVEHMVENGELSYFNGHLVVYPNLKDGGFLQVGWLDNGESPDAPQAPEAPDAPSAPTKSGKAATSAVMNGNEEAVLAIEEIENLNIELGGGEIFIESGDVTEIQITTECEDEFQSYIEDNTLYIKGFDLKDNFLEWSDWDGNKNSAHIIIPKELAFKETNISLGAGRIEIADITLGDTKSEIGAGEFKCRNTKSEQLTAELGAGAIHMEAIEAGETDISVSMGEAVLSGSFNKDVDLECSMGSIEVVIDGKEEEFNYSVEAAMGTVEVAGDSYEGIASEKNINNGADKTINAESAMGNIEINFAN